VDFQLGAVTSVWLWKEAILEPAFVVFLLLLLAISIIERAYLGFCISAN
jgi:hypothetical protein